MTDFTVQRTNMVESQVRPSDVTDRRIIRAMQAIPREAFVPDGRKSLAYADTDVPLNDTGRYLIAPRLLARMIQTLDLEPTSLALEIGCGTGYGAAVMGRIAQTVVGLENDPALSATASEALAAAEADNVVIVKGDLKDGYAAEAPYDAILIPGLVSEVPDEIQDQLKHGGKLVAVLDTGRGLGEITVFERLGDRCNPRVMFEAAAPRMPGFERAEGFVF